jgi:porphobilinogen synthase
MAFPVHRLRRLKRTEGIRRMVRETTLTRDDLILPLFVSGGENVSKPLDAIPGHNLLSGAPLLDECRRIYDLGIPAVLLFGIPEAGQKDPLASCADSPQNPANLAAARIKRAVPHLVIITDLCLCEYTDTGHCGVLKNQEIDNDLTLERIRKIALSQAQSGSDIIAPSGVMDGTVQAIRTTLDEAGFAHVLTMPYSAKYASRFYGPFKQATNSAPGESKHATHQLDVGNSRQAMSKIRHDVESGADLIIIKPALTSLDIITRTKECFDVPVAAYDVSGFYRLLYDSTASSPSERCGLMLEVLTCVKRAGADLMITYFAKEAAAFLSR